MSDAREYLTNVGPGPAPDSSRYRQWWEMRNALLAVLDLHREQIGLDDALRYCYDCEEGWPCATVRAIDKAMGVTDE